MEQRGRLISAARVRDVLQEEIVRREGGAAADQMTS
jgi:hypothetical protein